MRITNNITTQNALRTMQRGQREIAAANERVTTGLRFQVASEDPTAAAQVMRTTGSLRALDQYRRNIDAATARVASEEGVLEQLGDILARARELGMSQATGTADASTRQVAKAEVDELLRFAISLANTRSGEAYLFGGSHASEPPFAVDESDPAGVLAFTTTDPSGDLKIEISSGQLLSTSHDGTQVFGTLTDGPLAALRDLAASLATDDQEAIGNASTGLRTAFDGVQILVGDVGAWMNQLEMTGSNLKALKVTLETFRSDVQEVDFEQAVTELVGRQSAFQAAMMATSRVMGMNLTDYIR